MGNFRQAITYDAALEIDPNYVNAWDGKGWSLIELVNYTQAPPLYHNGAIKSSTNFTQIISNKFSYTAARNTCHTVTHVTRAYQIYFPMKVQTLFCHTYRIRYDQEQYPLAANLRNIKQKYQNFCN